MVELKYTVASSAVTVAVTATEVDGHPAEVHQKRLIVELLPEDKGNGSIKLVLPPNTPDGFSLGAKVTATFVVA